MARTLRPSRACLLGLPVLIALVATVTAAGVPASRVSRSQTVPVVEEFQPKVGRQGRSPAVTISPADSQTAVLAGFSGGLFKSTDGGVTWKHIDSFVPNRLWDVEYDPANASILVATVQVDTHISTARGIWRSTDGGATWQKPAGADDPSCPDTAPGRDIAFGPGDDLFVATDCGVEVSRDGGATWQHPPQVPQAWSVIARPGPGYPSNPSDVVVDACGNGGIYRSTDAGATWTTQTPAPGFSLFTCSLAGSPFETDVLLAASLGGSAWESDDGGLTWAQVFTLQNPGRRPWVKTHVSTDGHPGHFDLYFNPGADLQRQHCISSVAGLRCRVAAETGAQCSGAADDDGDGMFNEGCPAVGQAEPAVQGAVACKNAVDDDSDGAVNDGCGVMEFVPVGAAHDAGDIAFRTTAPNRDCPLLETNDGGVVRSTNCGITWTGPTDGPGALQIYDMAGTWHPAQTIRTGGGSIVVPGHTDLYIGTMDNQLWGSGDAGLTWPGTIGPEGFGLQAPQSSASHGQTVTGVSCFPCSLFQASDHLIGRQAWSSPAGVQGPPYLLVADRYIQVSDSASPNPLWIRDAAGSWSARTPLPPAAFPSLASKELFVAGPASNPTVYVVTTKPSNVTGLSRLTGLNNAQFAVTAADTGLGNLAQWIPDDNPFVRPHVVGVDPSNGSRLIAADAADATLKVSTTGGASWQTDPDLTALVTDRGRLTFSDQFVGSQAHVVAFDPANGKRILVGTEASGIIASLDRGESWFRVPGSRRIAAISDFYFDTLNDVVFVSSYGRGLWKVRLGAIAPADMSVAQTCTPDPVTVGEQVVCTATVKNGGPTFSQDVTLTNAVPAGLAVVSATTDHGSCTVSGAVSCDLVAFGNGSSATVATTFRPTQAAGVTLTSSTLRLTSATLDANQANNSATASITIVPANVDVVSRATPDPAEVGSDITYTMAVTNHGLAAVSNVTLGLALPQSQVFAAVKAPKGCTRAPTLTCRIGALKRGQTVKATLIVTPVKAGQLLMPVIVRHAPLNLLARTTSATAKVVGYDCTVVGTQGPDALRGTAAFDVVCGLRGSDVLDAAAGDDVLYGGSGGDRLNGGAGEDTEIGAAGDDTFDQEGAPNGFDQLVGGAGTGDRVDYSARRQPLRVTLDGLPNDGDATIASRVDLTSEGDNVGADVEGVVGGVESDALTGNNAGDNLLLGNAGDDRLVGGDGRDTLDGGPGADRLDDGAGDDTDEGGDGDDVIVEWPGADDQSGGPGLDTADYEGRQADLHVTLDGQAGDGDASGEGDNVRGDVERVIGGSGNDLIVGDETADNVLLGSGGADELRGLGGNDVLKGGGGDDRELGGAGKDRFSQDEVADGADVLSGGVGNDVVDYSLRSHGVAVSIDGVQDDGDPAVPERDNVLIDVEGVLGSRAGDRLIGSGTANGLIGGDGKDRIDGMGGPDRIDGGAGPDVESGGDGDDVFFQGTAINGSDRLAGGAGTDTAHYGVRTAGVDLSINGLDDDGEPGEGDLILSDIENLVGGLGRDTLTGSDDPNAISGGFESDVLDGRAGDDTLDGGPGSDVVDGGADVDTCASDPLDTFLNCEA
jgi:uncharacterized repeat protein (TIGR01451 family)